MMAPEPTPAPAAAGRVVLRIGPVVLAAEGPADLLRLAPEGPGVPATARASCGCCSATDS